LPWKKLKKSYRGRPRGAVFKTRRKVTERHGLELKERLARKLLHAPIGSVYYDGHKITVNFDGQVLSNKVVVVQHEKWVGHWSRSEPLVYIDNDVPMEFRKYVAFHETIEKYLTERYGLNPDAEAHIIAENVEHRYFTRRFGETEWKKYSDIVEIIHRREMAYHEKRQKFERT